MERSWRRIEAVVNAVDGEGLRPPADPADLDALAIPAPFRPLWARHDGQGPTVGGVFFGWYFLPLRGPVDTVEAELESVADGSWPIAKDFAGGIIAVDPSGAIRRFEEDTTELLADGLPAFLAKVAEALEQAPPKRWVKDGDRFVSAGRRTVSVPDLADWAVGEARDLCDGLVLVRVRSPDPAPFVQHGLRLDFAVDHPDRADARGAWVGFRVNVPTGPEGTVGGAPLGTSSQGGARWIEAQGPIPRLATLEVELDVDEPLGGPRPLFGSRHPASSADRGRSRLLLGDLDGALEDVKAPDTDPALVVEVALARRDAELAARAVERLVKGHPLRVRALAELHPERALIDADAWIASRPDGVSYAWRAIIHERLGHFAESVADTERAITELGPLHQQEAASLRTALRRRRARVAAPRAEAPILEDSTEDMVMEKLFTVVREGAGWRARVDLTPGQAAAGRLVEFVFPDGDRAAVRLPRCAGHGVRATVRVGPNAEPVLVELFLSIPDDWSSDADNRTLTFERWDVIAPVRRPGRRVRVVGLESSHEVDWPAGAREVRVPGGGLPRSDGTRGDLRVVAEQG